MRKASWIMIGTLSLLWGGSFFFVELALPGFLALQLVLGRVGIAALILAFALHLQGLARPGLGHARDFALQGLLNNVIPFSLFAIAQGQISGGLAAIVNATTPLWTVLIGQILAEREPLGPFRLWGLACGFAGVALLAGGRISGEAPAILACLLAALSYGLAAHWGRRFARAGLAPLQTAFGQVCASSVILVPLVVILAPPALPLTLPPLSSLAALVGLAALSTALAYLLFFRILAAEGATGVSLVTFLIPPSALALGAVFLGEAILPRHLAGLALILGGLALIGRKRRGALRG